jgi:DNA-binding LacI/PurR family transcriptional regulator
MEKDLAAVLPNPTANLAKEEAQGAEVAIVGFDNWEVIAAVTRPALTTVDMNLPELGRLAGTRLLAMIAGERASGIVRLPCSLVVRASCGAPATGDGPTERRGEADRD